MQGSSEILIDSMSSMDDIQMVKGKSSRGLKEIEHELQEDESVTKKKKEEAPNSKYTRKRKGIGAKSEESSSYPKKRKCASDIGEISVCSSKLIKSERNRLYYEKNKDKIKEANKNKKTKTAKSASADASSNSAKLSRREINRQYYKKNKDKIKEASKVKNSAKESVNVVSSMHSPKLTKSERNKLYYEKNKEKIKEARLKKMKDTAKHAEELAKRRARYKVPENRMAKLAAERNSYRDPVKHAAKLASSKAAYSVPEKRAAKLAAMRKSYRDPLKHAAKLAAGKESYRDPVKHAAVLARRKVAYADPQTRTAKLIAKSKSYNNPVNRALLLAKSRILYKNKSKEQKKKKKKRTVSDYDYNYILSQARKAMLEMPILACTVCHRARFKEQVKWCHRDKYPQTERVRMCFTGKYIHKCPTDCKDSSIYHDRKKKEWICFTCHRHLLKGNMPPQAAINNLWLDDIPEELKNLNALEMHLVSIVQPFMKIVPLPRGGQKGVKGQMVCVPANLQRTADSLPWTLNTNNLIRVKLKRKQQYKGHHLHMIVSQTRVMSALKKLMEINPAYKGNLTFTILFLKALPI